MAWYLDKHRVNSTYTLPYSELLRDTVHEWSETRSCFIVSAFSYYDSRNQEELKLNIKDQA
jgi:hypothetical protein